MASQASSTMDLSFESYDEYLQVGGSMVDQTTMHWGPDACGVGEMVGFAPTDVHKPAPCVNLDGFSHKEPECSWSDWDLPFEFDLESLLGGDELAASVNPPTPTNIQGGVVHPGTTHDVSPPFIGNLIKHISDPGSPDSGIGSIGSPPPKSETPGPASPLESAGFLTPGCASLSKSETSVPLEPSAAESAVFGSGSFFPLEDVSPDGSVCLEVLPNTSFPEASQEDIALLEQLWREDCTDFQTPAVSQAGPELLLTTVAFDQSPTSYDQSPTSASSPDSPKTPSRPTKALSTKEKKERKRAQNKNAATRYREKKRAEAQVIYEEQTKLEEKNKGLVDKMTLLAREVQCMKELLIEVYKARGLVE